MPSITLTTCQEVADHFQRNEGKIGADVYARGRFTSVWLTGLIEQKEWVNFQGKSIKNTIYERSGLTEPPTWTALTPSGTQGGEANSCLPPTSTIDFASTTQEYSPEHLALESVPICLNDILTSNEPRKAIESMVNNLVGNANYVWGERRRSEYISESHHKVIVTTGLPESATAFPSIEATSPLTMGVLKRARNRRARERNGTDPIAVNSRGAMCCICAASAETIENLVMLNDDVRSDFRWSDRANDLLGQFNEQFSYAGIIFLEDTFPERHNFEGGVYVRVPEYEGEAATLGTKLEISSDYEGAEHEVSCIVDPDVYCSRNPNPNVDLGNGVTYGHQNYRGEFRFENYKQKDCNPDGTIGWWRAVFMDATEPVFGQFGWAFMHLRCDPELGLMECPDGSGYTS